MCDEPVAHGTDVAPGVTGTHVHLDPVPTSVALARSFVTDSVGRLRPDVRDTVLLLTSELVTNAIVHARTALRVGVVVDDTQIVVAVQDRTATREPLAARQVPVDRAHGRGLALVDGLAEDWGVMAQPTGKSVWFVLSRSPAAARLVG